MGAKLNLPAQQSRLKVPIYNFRRISHLDTPDKRTDLRVKSFL